MNVNQLSIESQRKILKNVLNCMNYNKFITSVDDFLNQGYDHKNQSVDMYLKDHKAGRIINTAISETLNSDINTRIGIYKPQGQSYASDCHLHYSILINDEHLTQELVSNGAIIGKEEIQLAAEYGRASILKTLIQAAPDFDKNNIKIPSLYSPTVFFWATAQHYLGYEANYAKIEKVLENETVRQTV